MASRRNVRYSSLATDDNDLDSEGSQYDPRFYYTPKAFDKIPWKSIALAIFLLLLGSLLLFLSYFVLTGHMAGEKSQAYGLLALGFLTFLPGTDEIFCFIISLMHFFVIYFHCRQSVFIWLLFVSEIITYNMALVCHSLVGSLNVESILNSTKKVCIKKFLAYGPLFM